MCEARVGEAPPIQTLEAPMESRIAVVVATPIVCILVLTGCQHKPQFNGIQLCAEQLAWEKDGGNQEWDQLSTDSANVLAVGQSPQSLNQNLTLMRNNLQWDAIKKPAPIDPQAWNYLLDELNDAVTAGLNGNYSQAGQDMEAAGGYNDQVANAEKACS
jgi:hypothetical protein